MTEATKQNRNKIHLASLLHDIGKFYQRTDEVSVSKSEHLTAEIKRLEDTFCPLDIKTKGKRTHKHVLWTAQFIKDLEKQFRNIFIKESDVSVDQIMRMAAVHHNPSPGSEMELIIQKADHYSSGADRSKLDEAWKDASEEENWDSLKM